MMGTSVESFTVDSRIVLASASKRLDASFYNAAALEGIAALERSGMDLVEVRDLTSEVFIPNRFKRNYVSAGHGIPFLQGSHVIQFRPDDVKYLSKATHKNMDRLLIHSHNPIRDRGAGRPRDRPVGWMGRLRAHLPGGA